MVLCGEWLLPKVNIKILPFLLLTGCVTLSGVA